MIPLESRVPEIGTPGSESGGEETCPWASDCGPVRKRRISHRCPTGYAPPLDSTAQQRPVAETDQRPRVDPVEERPRLRRRQHRRRALRHDVLRTPHRRGRVHRQHLVDDQPVAERPDRGQVLLHRRHGPGVRPDGRGHVEAARSLAGSGREPRTTPGPPRRPHVCGARPVASGF